jgi:hypothetical protein
MASIASWRMGVEAAWSRYVTIISRVLLVYSLQVVE